MDTLNNNNQDKKNNKYFFGFFIAIIILIIITIVVYYITTKSPTTTEITSLPPPSSSSELTNVLTNNFGKKFILSTPNNTLNLTFQNFNVLESNLLPGNFTVIKTPLTLKFKYSDTFNPPITIVNNALYSLFTIEQNPVEVFNLTTLGVSSHTGFGCLAFEQSNSCQ